MARILIVEDEPNMRMGLRDNLEFEGYEVEIAEEGKSGLDKILNNSYHLVLLDVMMPNLSGFDVCKTARNKGIKTPIILLTAKGEEIDKVLGLELGADDYITKPFGLRELLARVKAVLRRTESLEENTPRKGETRIGNLTADFSNYVGTVGGKPVKMSHKEFEILHYLWNHKNETVSRNQLLENIWGYDEFPTTRTIDNFILKLRQKIESDLNDPKIILTVHGVGYKLIG
ncbi:response regulator transcription factor [Flexithrix dorotheae]|uniref:response regulator transcription factor n=1 Tax=Flexithrix dorotheae TaxID=70993 RepID=UPI0003749BF7|nr:response regulator transcription factor [Flexithrix dorotheae]